MAYYGILTGIEADLESIRVTWDLRDTVDTEFLRTYQFTFLCPPTGSRAEIREAIADEAIRRIRPLVESARAAQAHVAVIAPQLVGRTWPSQL